MRTVASRVPKRTAATACFCLLAAAAAMADVAADLRQAAAAIARRDLAAAIQRCRRGLEADDATADQRRQALDGLLAAALEAGHPAALAAYLQRRRAAAPEAQRRELLAAAVRCQLATDGHLHGAIGRLADGKHQADPQARRLAASLRQLCAAFGQLAASQAREQRRLALRTARTARPTRQPSRQPPRALTVPVPTRPAYTGRAARVARTRRMPHARVARLLSVPMPTAPRLHSGRAVSVRKPPLVRTRREALAAVFLSHFYQRAMQLMRKGMVENAKAELATVMQLFPATTQATQAAQYAIHLFQREHGMAQDAQAGALVAYLEWIRAVVGPQGADYAEYLALKRFAARSDATIVAREADAFIERHPDSKWLAGVRLQLAIALDTMGQPQRAIAILEPLASPLDSTLRVKAARILAWLHIFQGDIPNARALCQALAAQTLSPQDAADAKRLLEQMAEMPLAKAPLPVPDDAEEAAEALAERLLDAGDRLAEQGDDERAMDIFAVYLRTARGREGFWIARQRIGRLKEKGKAGDE